MKIPDIFNHLIQSGADGKPVSVRIVPVKHIENDGFIGVFFFKISLHHGKFIQVCQQCKISVIHKVFLPGMSPSSLKGRRKAVS